MECVVANNDIEAAQGHRITRSIRPKCVTVGVSDPFPA